MSGGTQPGFGPLLPIDGPPPIAPLYGLLQAAAAPAGGVRFVVDTESGPTDEETARALGLIEGMRAGGERWLNGVEVYPYPPDLADVHDPCAAGSIQQPKGHGSDLKHPQFGAMTIWIAETCTAYNVPSQEEYKARAVAALEAVQSAGVAHELLTGARMPLNPHLSDGNGTFPNGDAATGVGYGLALLEAEIAKSGRQGLIHCSPQVATIARERFALDNKSGVIRTINGIVVIPDFGYVNGASPHGHPAATGTKEWMYATGPIDVRRSETFVLPGDVAEAMDRGTGGASSGRPNSITYLAERYYLADWDTEVQAAVLVDRCQTTC